MVIFCVWRHSERLIMVGDPSKLLPGSNSADVSFAVQPGFLEQFFPEVTESAGGGMSNPTCTPNTVRTLYHVAIAVASIGTSSLQLGTSL